MIIEVVLLYCHNFKYFCGSLQANLGYVLVGQFDSCKGVSIMVSDTTLPSCPTGCTSTGQKGGS